MAAVLEQKNPLMEESSKDTNDNEIEQPILEFQRQIHQPHRFIPLMEDIIYNCELFGVRIAVLQILANAANDQEQFKVCGTCLNEYIYKEAAKK